MERAKTNWSVAGALSAVIGFLSGVAKWQSDILASHEPTFDGFVGTSFIASLLFLGVLIAGHFLARDVVRGRSAVYSATGAAGGMIAFVIASGSSLIAAAYEQNLLTLALGMPIIIGASLGYAYEKLAGFAPSDTHRNDVIEQAVGHGQAAPDLITTDNARYFAGPVVVRTSFSLMFGAGALLGALFAALAILLMLSGTLAGGKIIGETTAVQIVGMTVGLIVGTGVLMFLPTVLGHYAARFFKAKSANSYVGYGFLANIALGLFTVVFLLAAPFAIATLAIYYKLAGLEPQELPHDIRVRDPRSLIGSDHVSRRYHRVVGLKVGSSAQD